MKKLVCKLLKFIITLTGALLLLIIAGVVVLKIYHEMASATFEKNKKGAYGRIIALDNGDEMNICEYGEGDEVLVVMPGLGSVAPGLEYKHLAEELSDTYKVVVVEPFGYGLSDITDMERTDESICSEIHEALNKAGYDSFDLMAHSISAVYAITYLRTYPHEVKSFIGIDPSVPEQIMNSQTDDLSAYKIGNLITRLGITRALCALSSDEGVILPGMDQYLSPEEKTIYRSLAASRTCNRNVVNEVKNIRNNFEDNFGYKYPEGLDVHIFLSKETCNIEADWEVLHRNMLSDSQQGAIKILDGSHYLHLTCPDELVTEIRQIKNNEIK